MINSVKKEIISEYEELRTKAAAECEKRKSEVFEKFPEVKEFNKRINQMGLENTKRIFQNPKNAKEYNAEFKAELEKLIAERDKFYADHGIDPNFDKKVYSCSDCRDTGYLPNGTECRCFKEKIAERAYRVSSLGKTMKDMDFEHFSLKYYGLTERGGISEKDNMEFILSSAKEFCRDFDNYKRSLLFYGAPGLGKTFISVSIAKELINQGKSVTYFSAARLFSVYEDYKFGREQKNSDFFDDLYNSDLLIIDDLGTEFISKASVSFLFELINERIINGKKVIINTNLLPEALEKEYSVRFMSRVYEYFDAFRFFGKDIRVQKQYS